MGPSKPPTKVEREWMASIADLGCIACRKDGHEDTPAEVHHLIDGGRRKGHLFTIPLCPAHHKGDGRIVPSVHFAKRSFVMRYGSESQLLGEVQTALGLYDKVI